MFEGPLDQPQEVGASASWDEPEGQPAAVLDRDERLAQLVRIAGTEGRLLLFDPFPDRFGEALGVASEVVGQESARGAVDRLAQSVECPSVALPRARHAG